MFANIFAQSAFQNLPNLPKNFVAPQCVLLKDELLICGGENNNKCYSYHLVKKQYEYICSYPSGVELKGHCVLQLSHQGDNPDEIHLYPLEDKMQANIWSHTQKAEPSLNSWTLVAKSQIGELSDNLEGVRGVIGGMNNDLLFITHFPKNIRVIDLKTMKPLKGVTNSIIPNKENESEHCFVPLTMNGSVTKVVNHFLLFHRNIGLLISFDEGQRTFTYENLPTCPELREVSSYAFLGCYGYVFLFGGCDNRSKAKTRCVWKYSISRKIWSVCKSKLPTEVSSSFALLDQNNVHVHVIGGVVTKEVQDYHWTISADQLFQTHELMQIVQDQEQDIRSLKEKIASLELSRPYVIPETMEEKEVEQSIDKKVEPPKEWRDIQQQMKEIGNSLISLEKLSTMDWAQSNCTGLELWGCNGKAHLVNQKLLTCMEDIVTITTDLSPLGTIIDVGDLYAFFFCFFSSKILISL
ncbi:hypothetical protein RFI_01175 [Reticulomyxa filosa]|uniref:Kelch motif family protein n=1 Tax=Reticulomyxa filosa TaxID=46433 RepID=X6PCI8_RETFI|nr:hypothetical protein RFI_01175 [Reticulomyxa filosa]|eukprot:ETO35886.1 hypothetical protein RFI_01175 [Reticulomyxa filosa]